MHDEVLKELTQKNKEHEELVMSFKETLLVADQARALIDQVESLQNIADRAQRVENEVVKLREIAW